MGKRRLVGMVVVIALSGVSAPAVAAGGPPPSIAPDRLPTLGDTGGIPVGGDREHDEDYVIPPGPDGSPRARYLKWPGDTIRYWVDAPASFRWPIAKGVEAWNDTGLDVTFVRTSKARAQLTIRTVKNLGGALGLATLGYSRDPRWRWIKLDVDQLSPNDTWGGFTREEREVFTAVVVAHELGHTLGLDHAGSRCVLLHPIIYGGTCPFFAEEMGHYNCRIVDGSSLGRARRIYGGTRSLAPTSCPLDPLPPQLEAVTVSGGGPDADPGVIRWDPPRGDLPPGTRIQVLVRRDDSCDFSPRAPLKRLATYPDRVKVHLVPTSTRQFEVHAVRNEERVCLAASLVNESGGGRAPEGRKITLYTPQPPRPVVHEMRNSFSDPERYQVWLELEDGSDVDPLAEVYYAVGPEGDCPDTSPDTEGWYRVLLDGEDGGADGSVYAGEAGERPCFAFASYDRDRYSEVVTYQVGAEPPPSAPAVGSVRRDGLDGGYRITSIDGDPFPHDVLALVRPEGECAPVTWPADEDKHTALAYQAQDGTYQTWEDIPRACVTVYLVDGSGRVGPGVAVQTPPAAPPTKPVITSAAIVDEFTIRFDATYDEVDDRLVVVVTDQGACATAWDDELPFSYPWPEDEHFVVDNWDGYEHPCISVFAVNADGVHSAPAVKQL